MARGGGRSSGGSRGGGRSFGGSRGSGRRLGGGAGSGRGGSSQKPRRNIPSSSRPRGRSYGGIPPFLGGYGLGRASRRRGRYNRPGYNRGGCNGCAGGGCFSSILTLVVILLVFNFIWGMIPGNNDHTVVETTQVNSSTIEREAIEEGLVNETEYYEDKLNWIKNPSQLEEGLKYFYDKTNIQPFIYITDNINGDQNPSPDAIDNFSSELYDRLFTDEAHLLLLHFENYEQYQYEYSYHTVYGSQAKVLMDNEAEDILFDYLDYHYGRDSNKVSEEQFFSEAFKDTADRIMSVTRSPWIPAILVIAVAIILIILFNWWKSLLKKKKEIDPELQNKTKEKQDSFNDFDF